METKAHEYSMSTATEICERKAREAYHDVTSIDIPLTVSATAFQNQDGGSFKKFWLDFFGKIVRVGKIYASLNTPGDTIINIKIS